MKIIFFGSGDFGLPTLKKLLESRHEIRAVVTQPDKKKGRGWNVHPSLFKSFMEHSAPGIPVLQPEKVSAKASAEALKDIGADIFVVIDYGQMLSAELLDIPSKYPVNLHPSLLPKYRGAAPINRAVLAGEKVTGNTVIRMNERMDAGEIILGEKIPIDERDDAATLFEKLSKSGSELVLEALHLIDLGKENLVPQDDDAATLARKLRKEEGEIDWAKPAEEVLRLIRGMRPWPGAFTYLDGKMVKITKAVPAEYIFEDLSAGAVVDPKRLIVRAGKGFIRIDELQVEGKRSMSASEFLKGHRVEDKVFGSAN